MPEATRGRGKYDKILISKQLKGSYIHGFRPLLFSTSRKSALQQSKKGIKLCPWVVLFLETTHNFEIKGLLVYKCCAPKKEELKEGL